MTDNRYISHAKDDTFEEMVLSSDLPVLVDAKRRAAELRSEENYE